jgi:hypothetical protein
VAAGNVEEERPPQNMKVGAAELQAKQKKKRDKDAPKGPRSAYLFFTSELRPKLQAEADPESTFFTSL